MVKRVKHDEIAGVLEFKGRTSEDAEIIAWLAEHRARKGGKIRVSQGGTGVRLVFNDKADLASWQSRADQAARGKKTSVA